MAQHTSGDIGQGNGGGIQRMRAGSREGRGDYQSGSSVGGGVEDLYRDERDAGRAHRYPTARYNEAQHVHWGYTDWTTPLVVGFGALLTGMLIGRPWESGDRSEQQYRPNRPWNDSSSRGSRSVETDETGELIASNKVEGTAVYNRQGEKLGTVENFMVGKRSGQVAYAVMSFGGFLGIGERYHALPWNVLTYDTSRGGYVVDLDREKLSKAPSHGAGEDPFSDPAFGRGVREYWSATWTPEMAAMF